MQLTFYAGGFMLKNYIISELIKTANYLDKKGLYVEADHLDKIIDSANNCGIMINDRPCNMAAPDECSYCHCPVCKDHKYVDDISKKIYCSDHGKDVESHRRKRFEAYSH